MVLCHGSLSRVRQHACGVYSSDKSKCLITGYIRGLRLWVTYTFLYTLCIYSKCDFIRSRRKLQKKSKVFSLEKKERLKKWNHSLFSILLRLYFYRHIRFLPDCKCNIVVHLGHKSNQPDCLNQTLVLLLFVERFLVRRLMKKNMTTRKRRRRKMMTADLKICCCFWKNGISFIRSASRRNYGRITPKWVVWNEITLNM